MAAGLNSVGLRPQSQVRQGRSPGLHPDERGIEAVCFSSRIRGDVKRPVRIEPLLAPRRMQRGTRGYRSVLTAFGGSLRLRGGRENVRARTGRTRGERQSRRRVGRRAIVMQHECARRDRSGEAERSGPSCNVTTSQARWPVSMCSPGPGLADEPSPRRRQIGGPASGHLRVARISATTEYVAARVQYERAPYCRSVGPEGLG